MKLDLRRFRGETDHLSRRFEAAAFPLQDEDVRLAAPVDFEADIHKDKAKVRLTGRVRTTLEVACSRCLETFAVPVDAPLDLLFLPASENSGEGEQAVEEDDIGVSYYRDDEIDLSEVMREQFYLALPMKPLCREDCQGLCPVCGKNRNRETCDCQTAWVDPRMASLKKLLEK
jgi:uncharacterized protein